MYRSLTLGNLDLLGSGVVVTEIAALCQRVLSSQATHARINEPACLQDGLAYLTRCALVTIDNGQHVGRVPKRGSSVIHATIDFSAAASGDVGIKRLITYRECASRPSDIAIKGEA